MNTNTTEKIINQTTQHLANGHTVKLLFHYPANFKIGDVIEVTAQPGDMQLLMPQHTSDYFAFDLEIWDDRIRLYCDAKKDLPSNSQEEVFSFKIRDISLFSNRFIKTNNPKMYN
ncbi:MAG: hypothetical protein EOP41_01760 [Sphingobacteriaceae bacterium]|nr:MAG: hypothetical protein EOP41_01760 [Sphingobacteriaceae bacterium]